MTTKSIAVQGPWCAANQDDRQSENNCIIQSLHSPKTVGVASDFPVWAATFSGSILALWTKKMNPKKEPVKAWYSHFDEQFIKV